MYKVKPTTNIPLVTELHRLCFGDRCELDGDVHWLVWEEGTEYPVGFCSVRKSDVKHCAFLARAGLLPQARGQKLQRRLIRVRERWARQQGLKACITYVANDNPASLINLLKCGYDIYDPWDKNKAGKSRLCTRDGYVYVKRHL